MRDKIEQLKPVTKWFRSILTIIEAESKYRNLEYRTHYTEALKDFLSTFLRACGTGIHEVATTEEPLNSERDLDWNSKRRS